MKISESTLEVLQNFSSINNGITVQTGNEIKTISPMKNIFGKATISDNFTSQFSVYDLPEFLATISLLGNDAEFDFGENSVNISGNGASATYNYADASMIIAPPEKDITMPNPEVVFDLDTNLLTKLQKASAVLSLPDLVLESNGTVVSLSVRDKKNKYLKLIPYAWELIYSRSAKSPIFKDLNYILTKYFDKKKEN